MDNTSSYLSESIKNWRESFGKQRPREDEDEHDPDSLIPLKPGKLFKQNVKESGDSLLGDRFLCRSGKLVIVGETGAGKSSLGMQAAIEWALGGHLFGIQAARELSSVFLQAENDDGDLAEEIQGIVGGLDLVDELPKIDRKISIFKECSRTGEDLVKFVRSLCDAFRPDLFWLDPLLAFLGGDLSSQEVASKFLRNGLNPISEEFGTAFVLMHHVGKGSKEREAGAYRGTGSAELSNWTRAKLDLVASEDGYELQATKRATRSGLRATASSKHPGDIAYLRHDDTRICWRWAETAPTCNDLENFRARNDDIIKAIIDAGKPLTWSEIVTLIERIANYKNRKSAENYFAKIKDRLVQDKRTQCYTAIPVTRVVDRSLITM